MYSLSDIKSVHLEITNKCQAKCPMCARNMQGGILNPFIELTEITLEQFKEWFPVDFIKQLNNLYMCGNLGDPIIAKDTTEIFRYLRENNQTITLNMHTNGSGRNDKWWKDLAELNVSVIFGIDGLVDTHSLYRINTDFNKIIKNAKTFINHGGNARWDMIVFQHNEHQVEDCRKLSKELGFGEFTVKHTSRFRNGKLNVLNDEGKTINILYPTLNSKNMIPKIKQSELEVLPKINCKVLEYNQIYVSADGTVTPCCWINIKHDQPSSPIRYEYLDTIGYWPSLTKQTLEEIFDSGYFASIEKSWTTCGLKICSKHCGSFDKLNAQWVERT
jgi:MoaA/NifB/PqqE/SkfB family radical SAM enzyme